ncbi:grasp-with-spasm system SPASM domain peptide maturase [Aquimarina rhabdastrellae]
MKKKLLKLFTNCHIVEGYNRAVICDLQRLTYLLIPKSLVSLFDENQMIDVEAIKKELDIDSKQIFEEYLQLLYDNDLVFLCNKDELKRYPSMDLEFDYHAAISNFIIDFNKESEHSFKHILDDFLIPTNCRNIQVRCFDVFDYEFIESILDQVENSFVKTIDIIIKDSQRVSNQTICSLVRKSKKVRTLTIHSAKENAILQKEDENGFGVVVSIQQEITSSAHCGIIQPHFFNVSIENFTESQKHNSCLNRKMSIDANGNIKNCPSMREIFGNINKTSLSEVLGHKDLKKYWNISKDQISVCKDCEFRYICTDCRAYKEEPENDYSKPLKCGYDPYTNEWTDWSQSPLKQKAMKYFEMK